MLDSNPQFEYQLINKNKTSKNNFEIKTMHRSYLHNTSN